MRGDRGGTDPVAHNRARLNQAHRAAQTVVERRRPVRPRVTPTTSQPRDQGPTRERVIARGRLLVRGNIDLRNRPVVRNRDGTVSTVKSFSIGTDRGEVLLPQVVGGQMLTRDQAIRHYQQTGRHLGIFTNAAAATRYAEALHRHEARRVAAPATPSQKAATIFAGEEMFLPGEVSRKPPPPPRPPSTRTREAPGGLTRGEGLPTYVPPLPSRYRIPVPVSPATQRYRQALAAPASLVARRQLARTLTPERRAQYFEEHPVPPLVRPATASARPLSRHEVAEWQLHQNMAHPQAAALPGVAAVPFVGGIAARAYRDLTQAAIGFPQGVYDIGESAVRGLTAEATGHTVRGKQLMYGAKSPLGLTAADYARRYGPLFRGDLGQFAHNVSQQPGVFALDVIPALGALGKLGEIGGIVGESGRLLHVPKVRTLTTPEGLELPLHASPSVLTRAFQTRVYDPLSEAHPEVPLVGSKSRAVRRIQYLSERTRDQARAAGIPFAIAQSRLRDPRLKVAYSVLHDYGGAAKERLAQEIQLRETQASSSELGAVERANQHAQVLFLKAAQPFVERYFDDLAAGKLSRPSKKLKNALDEGVPLAERGQQIRTELGLLDPASAAERIHLHSQIASGGKVMVAQQSKTLKDAYRRQSRLEKAVEKARAIRDRNAPKQLARLRAREARTIPAKPHTVSSAVARRDELRAQNEKFMRASEKHFGSTEIDQGEAATRLAEHDARIAEAEQRVAEANKRLEQYNVDLRASRGAGLSFGEWARQRGFDLDKSSPEQIGQLQAEFEAQGGSLQRLSQAEMADKHGDVIEEAQAATAELNRLKRERAPLKEMAATGRLRSKVDPAETARRNNLRRQGIEVPTVKEEIRAEIQRRLDAAVARNPDHPVFQRYAAARDELAALEQGLGDVQLRLLGGEKLTAEDLAGHLGHQHGPIEVPPTAHMHTPAQIVSEGRVIPVKGTPRVERLSSALSNARDEVQRLEAAHVKRFGFLPDETPRRVVVGGEPAGPGAAYISDQPTRTGRAIRFARSRSLTGRRAKQGFQYRTEGKLFSEARARRSSKVVLQDWAASAKLAAQAQDVRLIARSAETIDPETLRVEPGYRLFNPEGIKVPRVLSEARPEELLPEMLPRELAQDAIDKHAEAMSRMFPSQGAAESDFPRFRQAVEEGRIMQVPEAVAARFERGWKPPAAHNQVSQFLLDVVDSANNLTKAALMYLTLGFAPANLAGNVVFGGIQQGPWFFKNVAQAARLMGDYSLENLRWMDVSGGTGAMTALSSPGRGLLGGTLHHVQEASGMVSDRLPRRAAVIHELAKIGVKNDADLSAIRAATEASPNGPEAQLLNQALETAEKAMVRYRNLSPFERNVIGRAIFVYPWMKGATQWGLRLPLDRPIQAGVMNALGQEGYKTLHRRLGGLLSYEQNLVTLGEKRRMLGTDVVPVSNVSSITPTGTVAQVAESVAGLLSSRSTPAALGVANYLNPMLGSAASAALHYDVEGGHQLPGDVGFLDELRHGLAQNLIPGKPVVEAFGRKTQTEPFAGSAAKQRLFVQQGGPWEALKVSLLRSARPRDLNLPAYQAKEHAERRASMTPGERVLDTARSLRQQALEAYIATGALPRGATRLPKGEATALVLQARRQANYASLGIKRGMANYQQEALKADVTQLTKWGYMSSSQAKAWIEATKNADDNYVKNLRTQFNDTYYGGAYIRYMRKVTGLDLRY